MPRAQEARCVVCTIFMAGDRGGHLGHVAGHDEGGGCVGGHLAVGIHGFFSNLELYGLFAPGWRMAAATRSMAWAVASANGLDGFGFALGLVDDGLLFALRRAMKASRSRRWRC